MDMQTCQLLSRVFLVNHRVENGLTCIISVSRQDVVWCFGHYQGALGCSKAFLPVGLISRASEFVLEPTRMAERLQSGPLWSTEVIFIPCEMFERNFELFSALTGALNNFIQWSPAFWPIWGGNFGCLLWLIYEFARLSPYPNLFEYMLAC